MACMSKPSHQTEKGTRDRVAVACLPPLEFVYMDGDLDISDAELEALELLLGEDLQQFLQ